jgi:hypothetical protein
VSIIWTLKRSSFMMKPFVSFPSAVTTVTVWYPSASCRLGSRMDSRSIQRSRTTHGRQIRPKAATVPFHHVTLRTKAAL